MTTSTVLDHDTDTDTAIEIPPTCEARIDGHYHCDHQAKVIVRFKAHGCRRDGRGVLLCAGCRDWIASTPVWCGACDGQEPEGGLFIVSSVALT